MGWIEKISNGIQTVFDAARPAAKTIAPLLMLCELANRPGLSAIALTSAIISRLGEAGIPTEPNPDGTPNKICLFVRILCEEIVTEIKNNAVVSSVVEVGSIVGQGTGANAGGPVTVITSNIMMATLKGLIQ